MTYGILFPRTGALPMLRQLLLILPLVLIAGCTASPAQEPAQELDLTLPEGDVLTDIDTHGGFHGDGNSCLILAFSPENGETLAQELAEREDWRPLPLDEQSAHVLDSTLSLLDDEGLTYTLPSQGWRTMGWTTRCPPRAGTGIWTAHRRDTSWNFPSTALWPFTTPRAISWPISAPTHEEKQP